MSSPVQGRAVLVGQRIMLHGRSHYYLVSVRKADCRDFLEGYTSLMTILC